MRRLASAGAVWLIVVHSQHFEHALHRRERALQFGKGVHDVPDRVEQEERVPLKGHDIPNRCATLKIQKTAIPDDHDIYDRQQQPPCGPEHQFAAMREHFLPQHGMPADHVIKQLMCLAAERAHDANPGKRFPNAPID